MAKDLDGRRDKFQLIGTLTTDLDQRVTRVVGAKLFGVLKIVKDLLNGEEVRERPSTAFLARMGGNGDFIAVSVEF